MPHVPRPAAVRGLVAAILVSSVAGCATKGDVRDLQMELRRLTARQDSLLVQLRRDALAEARSTQDTLRTQGNQLVDLRGEIMRQLREINETLATLQAIAGENQRSIASVRDQLVNLRREPVAQRTPDRDSVAGATGGVQRPGSPEELYNAALQQFNRRQLNTARGAFQSFLRSYPNHSQAPDARYFLADILVQENRPEEALEAFQEIPRLFPTAETVPKALYRAAVLHVELGDREEAVAILERILNTYPDTDSALLAQDRLDEIRDAGQGGPPGEARRDPLR